MANRVIEFIYRLKDQFTKESKKVNKAQDDIGKNAEKSAKNIEAANKKAAKSFTLFKTPITLAAGAIAGFALAVRKLLSAYPEWIRLSQIQERAEVKLATTLKSVVGASDEQIKALKDQAAALQELTGVGDETIISAQAMLGTFRLTTDQIQALTPALLDAAEANRRIGKENVNLEQIAISVGKAFTSGIGSLTRWGVAVSEADKEAFKLADTQGKTEIILRALDANYKGLAEAVGKTYEGAVRGAQAAQGDFGEAIGDSITKSESFIKLADTIKNAWQEATKGIKDSGDTLKSAMNVVAGSIIVALNAVRAAWNTLQLFLKTTELSIVTAAIKINEAFAKITFGEISARFSQNAAELRESSKDLLVGIRTDVKDLATSVVDIGRAFETSGQKTGDLKSGADAAGQAYGELAEFMEEAARAKGELEKPPANTTRATSETKKQVATMQQLKEAAAQARQAFDSGLIDEAQLNRTLNAITGGYREILTGGEQTLTAYKEQVAALQKLRDLQALPDTVQVNTSLNVDKTPLEEIQNKTLTVPVRLNVIDGIPVYTDVTDTAVRESAKRGFRP